MNEFITSLLVVGTQIGIVVGVALIIVLLLFIKKRKKDKNIAQQFDDDFKFTVYFRRF